VLVSLGWQGKGWLDDEVALVSDAIQTIS
jgi:hypothetical protein